MRHDDDVRIMVERIVERQLQFDIGPPKCHSLHMSIYGSIVTKQLMEKVESEPKLSVLGYHAQRFPLSSKVLMKGFRYFRNRGVTRLLLKSVFGLEVVGSETNEVKEHKRPLSALETEELEVIRQHRLRKALERSQTIGETVVRSKRDLVIGINNRGVVSRREGLSRLLDGVGIGCRSCPWIELIDKTNARIGFPAG
jgi:hypothetical protein